MRAFASTLLLTSCLAPSVVGPNGDSSGSTSTTSTSSEATTTVMHDLGTHDVPHWPSCDGFICSHDLGDTIRECDVWAQDCPAGEKCMPWSNDGGSAWNDLRCSPIAPMPKAPGEPCTVVESGVSGLDDCDRRSMCWNIEPETLMGECVEFCVGSEANPLCPDPSTSCAIAGEAVLVLCLPLCSPIESAFADPCSDLQGCYPAAGTFACAPDASGELGAWGDPCEYINVCDAGLFCGNPDAVPGCRGSQGCCNDFCDLSSPYADAYCGGALLGQVCVPWFEEGQAPAWLVDVGACVLPP